MAHDTYQHMMSLSLDGGLPPEDEAALERHLSTCDTCAATWDSMRGLDALFQQTPMVAPTMGFSARVMAGVEAHRTRRRWPETVFWMVLMVLLAGVMIAQCVPSLVPLAAGVGFGPLTGLADAPGLDTLRTIGAALVAVIDVVVLWLTYIASLPFAWMVGLGTLALVATWVGLIGVFGPGQPRHAALETVRAA